MRSLPLWMWGLIFIFVGVVMGIIRGPAEAPGTPEERAAALGRASARLTIVAAGVVLLVVGLIRRSRGTRC